MTSPNNITDRKRWWELGGDALAKNLFDEVKGLCEDRRETRNLLLMYFRAFSLQQANRLRGLGHYPVDESFSKLRINVIKSVIHTGNAYIGCNKTRAYFMTAKGKRRQRDEALAVNRGMLGLFYAGGHYDVSPKVFESAAIFGVGTELVQPTAQGRILYSRVFPLEQVWDENECLLDEPRNRYIAKEVSKDELATWAAALSGNPELKNPKGAELIEHLWTSIGSSEGDSCTLIFAWRRPSYEGATDGRYACAISNQLIHSEVWDTMVLPLVDYRVYKPQVGFLGDSFASILIPYQLELNYIVQKQQSLVNLATTKIAIKKGEGFNKLDNRNMGLIEYKNTAPQVLNITPYSREFNEWREMVKLEAHHEVGFTQMATQGMKPAGLDSGAGQREFKDIANKRLQESDSGWDMHHVNIAEATLAACRRIAKSGTAPKHIMAMGDRYVEQLPFETLTKYNRNNCVLKPFPASMLPEEPAGKVNAVYDLMRVSPQLGPASLSLLSGIPDVEAAIDRIQAPYELLDFHLTEMITGSKQHLPDSNMDLSMCRIETQRAICQAEKDEEGAEVIDRLARYLAEVDRLQTANQPMMAPPMPGAGVTPGAPAPGEAGLASVSAPGPSGIPSPQSMMQNPGGMPPPLG